MKRFAILFFFIANAFAQSTIAVTAPSAGAVISGFSYLLTCSLAPSVSNLYSVEYFIDGERAGVTIADGSGCPALKWDPYYAGNGAAHQIKAVARDALGSILSTSAPVTFAVENNLPQNTCDTICTDLTVE